MTILKLPIVKDPMKTFARWASEIRVNDFLTAALFRKRTWEPTLSASGSMTLASVTIRYAFYFQFFGFCLFFLGANFTTGGVADTIVYYTLPKPHNENDIYPFNCLVTDTNVLAGVSAWSSGNLAVAKRYDNGNWSLAANNGIRVIGLYVMGNE